MRGGGLLPASYVLPAAELPALALVIDRGRRALVADGLSLPPSLLDRIAELVAIGEAVAPHVAGNGSGGNGSDLPNGNRRPASAHHATTLDPVLLSAEAAARVLGVKPRRARQLAPVLGGRKVGGDWRVPLQAVQAERDRRMGKAS